MQRVVLLVLVVFTAGCAAEHAEPAPPIQPRPQTRAQVPRTLAEKRELFARSFRSFERGDFDDAANGFEALVDRYPELEDYCLHYLAVGRARRGEGDSAMESWARLTRNHPKSRFTYSAILGRGRLLRERGDLAASRAELTTVLDGGEAVEVRAALWELAAIDEAEGDTGAAYASLMRIRREAPGTSLGRQAKESVLRLRSADPGLAGRGESEDELRLLIAEADHAAAIELADRLLATSGADRRPAILRQRADVERALGRFDGAVQTLRVIVRDYPGSDAAEEALFRASVWLWNRDRDAEAKDGFREHLRRYPDVRRSEVLYALGRIEEAARDDAAAASRYSELASLTPPAKERGEALWRIGWMRYQAGDWNGAAQAFDRARSGGDSDSAVYWKARALERAGEPATAARIYERILSDAPNGYYAYWAEQRLGRDSPARRVRELRERRYQIGDPPAPTDEYHLSRARELRAAGLTSLARAELRAFERSNGGVDRFLIDAYPAVDGYRDAIRLSAGGSRDPEVLYPLAFWPLVRPEAEANGVDPLLALSMMRQESLFDPAARSSADARGLMQLLPSTAERVAERSGRSIPTADLYDPKANISLGTAYLGQLSSDQQGDWIRMLAAYNGGENALAKWEERFGQREPDEFVESITYRETRDYVKKVLSHYRHYVEIYGAAAR
jgi:soluble lytic murein transglycosylase